ncbi:unnamed protein product [Mesocestoides corti]|uniref:MATH domain-containing protein n=1 Tax=Mesocestoides corti TaxID=53468 RepID=A0A0R3U426_MESCO|nr:unnamed protein product [Mesocestoides corti]
MNLNSVHSQYIPLVRFTQLSTDDALFVFAIPSSFVRGFLPEIESSNFEYFNHFWRLKLQRTSLHVGAHLELIIPIQKARNYREESFIIWLDLSITVINLTHFSDNQTFTENVFFNPENMSRGSKCLVEASELQNRNFVNEYGKLFLELELANPTINLNVFLTQLNENCFESGVFEFGGSYWRLGLTADQGRHAFLSFRCLEPRHVFVQSISFSFIVDSNFHINQQVDLLIGPEEEHIRLADHMNLCILSSLKSTTYRCVLPVCLANINLLKFSLISLPQGLENLSLYTTKAFDTKGFDWDVVFSVCKDRLYVQLVPPESSRYHLDWDTIRTVGWSWSFWDLSQATTRPPQQMYICQHRFPSLCWLQTDSFVQKESIDEEVQSLSNQKCVTAEGTEGIAYNYGSYLEVFNI